MKLTHFLLSFAALFLVFTTATCSDNSTNSTTGKTSIEDIDIHYNNTIVTEKTYTHRFVSTPVCYTKGETSGSKRKVYVPGIQYVPGHMGYQPKYVDIRFTQCSLGENQMIVFSSPFLSNDIDITTPLSESPDRANLITQELLDAGNGTFSLKLEPGQCLLVLSYYAEFAVDEKTNELVVMLKETVNCTISFSGSDESKMVPSLYMFVGTLIITVLPGVLVVIFGLFIKPREEESKTSVGYQKRLRSSITCMYIMSFILCFIAFIALLVITLI